MKNLLLTIVFVLGCVQVNAQKLTPKFLEGNWETEFHDVEFKGQTKKDFTIIMTLKETGEKVEVLNYVFDDNKLYIETRYAPTEFKAIGKIIIMDENTMVEDVFSEYSGLLIYKRKQTN
jgi:hypothetical protein